MKFLFLLKKILKGNNLTTGIQCYTTTKNFLEVESLQVFENKYRSTRNETMKN